MGYDTTFIGKIAVEPPLSAAEVAFLKQFSRDEHEGRGFPGKYCQWIATEDGTAIEWDGGEKFYDSEEWMAYLVQNFLGPGIRVTAGRTPETKALEVLTRNHILNGVINAEGEDNDDIWRLVVKDNQVSRVNARVMWPDEE
jgi:hypothetical protein